MIDSHAHLMMLKEPASAVITRAKAAGLTGIVNVAVDLESAKQSQSVAKEFQAVYATIGIHPLYAEKFHQLQALIDFAKTAPDDFVAVGEAGLDYKYGKENRDDQLKVLEGQYQLAQNLDKSIILHNRMADADIIEMMNAFPDVPAVVHCFASDWAFINAIHHDNFCISFNGMITIRLNAKIQEVIQRFPLERMMLETDCPYLTPKKYGQQANEPAFMAEVVPVIADIKGCSQKDVIQATTQKAKEFFKIG